MKNATRARKSSRTYFEALESRTLFTASPLNTIAIHLDSGHDATAIALGSDGNLYVSINDFISHGHTITSARLYPDGSLGTSSAEIANSPFGKTVGQYGFTPGGRNAISTLTHNGTFYFVDAWYDSDHNHQIGAQAAAGDGL